MKKDQIRIFGLEVLLIVILFFALFALNMFTRSLVAIFIFIYAVIVSYMFKIRKITTINKNNMIILMTIFSMFYLGIFYLLGIHFGFISSKILFSLGTTIKYILPLSLIIVSSEVLRRIFLSHKVEIKYKDKKIEISSILTYILMVIIDIIVCTEVYDMTNLDDFLLILGFVFFSSLSCNLLYHYITPRYGSKGIIIYKLITTLYIYILPIVPKVYIFFRIFLRLLYPYIMYIVIEKLFSKNDYTVMIKDRRKEMFANTIMIVIATLFVMLVSCQFRFGLLVVGSESMTGTLDKGDALIFEKYTTQEIVEGQVIIFNYENVQTIHRVIDIQKVNGEYRYFTQGDANSKPDEGYRVKDDISSLVKLRIKYIGYPTLFVRSIFEK